MTQLSIAENAPLDLNPDLAQWFTPDWLADHVAELVPVERLMWHPYRVLEPAAGDGALIRAMLRITQRGLARAIEVLLAEEAADVG